MSQKLPITETYLSVDCVVLGYDGEYIKVLLKNREGNYNGIPFHDRKLPGSLIAQDEDLDEAASRVLRDLTGIESVSLAQFKAYGTKDRTKKPLDVNWLEKVQNVHVERIVTIAYLAIVKIGKKEESIPRIHDAEWVNISEVGELGFDHNLILLDALKKLRDLIDADPSLIFTLLPKKFTAKQLRDINEIIFDRPVDARNFHKKLAQTDYIVPLEEKQQGVAHRAARFYRFDKKLYIKSRK